MVLVEILTLLLLGLFALYKWATYHYNTFTERGLPFEKPLPLFGNGAASVFGTESDQKIMLNFYRRNKAHKVCGFFSFRVPTFIVIDPELIKKITVKDFDHFPNHVSFFDTENEPLLDGMLSLMKDQRWKDMRNTLSPAFTSSKMRAMFVLMNESFDESLKYIHEKLKGEGSCELELKECFTRLSNDLIASTAFGLKINSFVNLDNEFYSIGQSITNFKGAMMLKMFLVSVAPKLMNLFGFKVFDTKKSAYFMRLVVDAMKYREENNIVRPDMIQLLMEAKKESTQNWSDEELVAQCFIFFFAAFENNATLICTTCHELMENPDVQEHLYEEACEVQENLKGAPLDYDVVNKMKYMDMVLSESLRKWSLAFMTDRVCTKDYKLTDDEDNLVCDLKVGDRILIPIGGLHWDENYFDNPEGFVPERFSDENKDNIRPFTYLPFGVGPRVCIGNRYALMQAKAMLYHLVLNFKLERSPKTVKNLMDDIRGFNVTPKSGFWMRFVKRKLLNETDSTKL